MGEHTLNKLVFLILTLSLVLLLSACSNQGSITAGSLQEAPTLVKEAQSTPDSQPGELGDLCGGQCKSKEICIDGDCICKSGFKECNGSCIPVSACCSDDDCEVGLCNEKNRCESRCREILCPYNMVCSEETQECKCGPGTRFCELQQRCIEEDRCCSKIDCRQTRTGKACVDITISAKVCFRIPSLACKDVREGGSKSFTLNGVEYTVFLSKVFNGDVVDIKVDETIIEKLTLEQEYKINEDLSMFIEKINYLGGECRFLDRN